MEIGGYFGLEPLISNEYYKDLIPLNTARNALLYILKARKIQKLYIPYYLCDSISEMCDKEGCSYEFYRIDSDFRPVFEKESMPIAIRCDNGYGGILCIMQMFITRICVIYILRVLL